MLNTPFLLTVQKPMNKKEKLLLRYLCNIHLQEFDEKLLRFASPEVLGYIFSNRMQTIAYCTLKKHNYLDKVPYEFRTALKLSYIQLLELSEDNLYCIQLTYDTLKEYGCNYGFAGDTYLSLCYAPLYRSFDNISLIVNYDDINKISSQLKKHGFEEIKNDITTSIKTIEFNKNVKLPITKNFKVNIKVTNIINKFNYINYSNLNLKTSSVLDTLLLLCIDLYDTTTTFQYITTGQDMLLYKYFDIYTLLRRLSPSDVDNFFTNAYKYNLQEICSFAIIQTACLFNIGDNGALSTARKILEDDSLFLHLVMSKMDEKMFIYTEPNILNRFFSKNRKNLLKEFTYYDKIRKEDSIVKKRIQLPNAT